jgi:hypothetical protein
LSSRATISIRRSWDTTSLWPSPTRASNALPAWHRRLGLRIAAHDLALAAHRALGDQDDRIEQTRLAVADVLDGARAADASEDELDAFIHQLRIDQCVLVSHGRGVAGRRARPPRSASGLLLPAASWATTAEIADDRGAPLDVVASLVEDALDRGLFVLQERRVVLTSAGHEHVYGPRPHNAAPAVAA